MINEEGIPVQRAKGQLYMNPSVLSFDNTMKLQTGRKNEISYQQLHTVYQSSSQTRMLKGNASTQNLTNLMAHHRRDRSLRMNQRIVKTNFNNDDEYENET